MSSEDTDFGRPHIYLQWLNRRFKGRFKGFLVVPRPNVRLIFHRDLFIRPLYRFQFRLGPLISLPSGDVSGEGDVVPFGVLLCVTNV